MADELLKFAQLTKVDAKLGQVWGIISSETPDDSGEIMDYEHSKPNFLKWSEKIVKASGGKSKGNVRTMHNGQMIAVGKVIHFEARDDSKDFFVGAQIVDKQELEKVYSGVYTGFSIGGSYGAWKQMDGQHKRYEAVPVEVSLVDNPCNPDATFSMVKEDGAEELRKFVTSQKGDAPMADEPTPETIDELLAKAATSDDPAMKEFAEKLTKAFNFQKKKEDPAPADAPADKPAEDKPADEPVADAAPADDKTAQPAAEQKPGEQPAGDPQSTQEGGAADEPKPTLDGEAVDLQAQKDALRAAILSILEELGLVVKEGETMKAVQSTDLQKSAEALDLVKADFAKTGDELRKMITALTDANEQLTARVEKVTGFGPVVMMTGGAGAAESSVAQEVAILRKYQESATTPADRARFGELIAQAEIKTIHLEKKG